jgi:hypothetical protein
MQLLALLIPILFIVSFVGYVMLAIAAFKHSTQWGLLVVFLSPFTAVIFAIKNWDKAKKPFMLYAGSLAGCLLLMVISFSALGGFEMMSLASRMEEGEVTDAEIVEFFDDQLDRVEKYGDLSEEDQQQMALMRQTLHQMEEQPTNNETPDVTSTNRIPDPITNSSQIETAALSRREVPEHDGGVALDKAHTLIGMFVKIRDKAGKVHKGVLLDVKSASLTVERQMAMGTMSYDLYNSEIEWLRLLDR